MKKTTLGTFQGVHASPSGISEKPRADQVTQDAAIIHKLRQELAEAHREIARLREISETDPMLAISNRRGLERELTRAIAYIGRYKAGAALVFLDVDGLKPVNDTFGHEAGDALLRAITAQLQRHVRASDTVARVGGDEFVLLLWHLSEQDAQAKATLLETVIDTMETSYGGHTIRSGISAGFTMLSAFISPQAALRDADQAMYRRKRQRRLARDQAIPVEQGAAEQGPAEQGSAE